MSQLTRGKPTRIMYLELKSGYSGNGPARIGRVSFSRSGRAIFYRGKTFRPGGGPGNYCDVETGEGYWISGIKLNGEDRHWAGSGKVEIDEDVREEYSRLVAATSGAS